MTPEEVAASYDEADEELGEDDDHDLDPDFHAPDLDVPDPDPAGEP
jgi:hypothetical protein